MSYLLIKLDVKNLLLKDFSCTAFHWLCTTFEEAMSMSEVQEKTGFAKYMPYIVLLGAFAVLIAVGIATS
jgi:hypothetical protein